MTIDILGNKTRRELCEDCPHCMFANVQIKDSKGLNPDDFIELPTCRLKYRRTCEMRRAFGDKSATCPHPDPIRAETWNAAKIEEAQPCESPNAARSRVREELPNGVTIYRDTAARTPQVRTGPPNVRGVGQPIKVMKESERFYYD